LEFCQLDPVGADSKSGGASRSSVDTSVAKQEDVSGALFTGSVDSIGSGAFVAASSRYYPPKAVLALGLVFSMLPALVLARSRARRLSTPSH
jgi:hypothetical protein